MGIIFGRTMETNFEKQREFMLEMNQVTIERNIQMQNQVNGSHFFMYLYSEIGFSLIVLSAFRSEFAKVKMS